jgi:phosphoribosylformylglycinamidine cyclo-ligase
VALSYRATNGGDVNVADLIERLRPLERWTRTPEVIDDGSGPAGLYTMPSGLLDPVLVSASGGIGGKLKIAIAAGKHDVAGRDVVAILVNDLVASGAKPLFFVHHLACGKLDLDLVEQVVSGVAAACRNAGCPLVGGETAELSGTYVDGQYDLAGFAVGAVSRGSMLGRDRLVAGDHLVAVASSGLHAEGHVLARKVLEQDMCLWLGEQVPELGSTVGEALCEPTRIYAAAVEALRTGVGEGLRALCHVSTGGIEAGLRPLLPEGLQARVDLESFERPPLFRLIAEGGKLDEAEMRKTFNLGVGLIAVVSGDQSFAAVEALESAGEVAWVFGDIRQAEKRGVVFT